MNQPVLHYGSHGVAAVFVRRIEEFLPSTELPLASLHQETQSCSLHLNPAGITAQSQIPQDLVRLLPSAGIDKGSGCSCALKNSRLFLLQDKDSFSDNMILIALANTCLGTLYPFKPSTRG